MQKQLTLPGKNKNKNKNVPYLNDVLKVGKFWEVPKGIK